MSSETKPGPTADRIAELERRLVILDGDASMGAFLLSPEENQERIAIRAELSRLRNEQPELNKRGDPMDGATVARGRKPTDAANAPLRNEQPKGGDATLYPSVPKDNQTAPLTLGPGSECDRFGVATSPGPQDVRGRLVDAARAVIEDRKATAPEFAGRPIPIRNSVLDGLEAALVAALAQSGAQPVGWRCKARHSNTGANDPAECDWPVCGCDPYADRVIDALEESGRIDLSALPPSGAQPSGSYRAARCDDGTWMVCSDGDVVCTFDSNGTDEQQRAEHTAELLNRAEAAPSPATSPGPQDMREKIAQTLCAIRGFGFYIDPMEGGQDAYDISCEALNEADALIAAFPALAQSDAQPVGWHELEPGQLRPCPFCGGEANRVDDVCDGGSVIECSRCHASTSVHYDRKENLFSDWNDRTTPPALPEGAREALESASNHLEEVLKYSVGGTFNRTGIQAALIKINGVLRAADRSAT